MAQSFGVTKSVRTIREEKQKKALRETFLYLSKLDNWEAAKAKYGNKCDEFLKSFLGVNLKKGFIPKAIVSFVNALEQECANASLELESESSDNNASDNIDITITVLLRGESVVLPGLENEINRHKDILKDFVNRRFVEVEQ